ncbi:MAG: hypothetical protein RBT78_11840 [Kiritimatiellia bacterium]|jgi:hypothetical protein|nr:hypothetical protein [Kiritimatiellia bacterium]
MILALGEGRAETLTWVGGTNDWQGAANWTNWVSPAASRVPADGDTAVVTQARARVDLSQTSARLASLVISNATVSCAGWDTVLYATHLTVWKDGVLTCEGPFTHAAMSNRVNVVCENLRVENGGAIQTDGKGYAGGSGVAYAAGQGPGGGGPGSGPSLGGGVFFGGSHGGSGRNGANLTALSIGVTGYPYLATNTYGTAEAPLLPGSGGVGPSSVAAGYMGGSGGGAIRIEARSVMVNGRICANGSAPVGYSHASAGSGGSVYITCVTLDGTNGTVSADAGPSGGGLGGGAGGGRIAVAYAPAEQSLLPVPTVAFSAAPSLSGGSNTTLPGDIGTLWFPDGRFFSPSRLFTGQWMAPEPAELTLSDWTVSNVWVRLPVTNLTVAQALKVVGTDSGKHKLEFARPVTVQCGQTEISGAALCVGNVPLERTPTGRNPHPRDAEGSSLLCAGDLALTNAARLYVYAGLFRSGQPEWCGAQVGVAGDLAVGTNCWIFPVAHPTNGAAPVFSMRNLRVAAGGGFNADALGYSGGTGVYNKATAFGPGRATGGTHGAGYGGAGTPGYLTGSPGPGGVYGSAEAPTAPGSGARAATSGFGADFGPYGGGSVQIRAERAVALNGVISANGGSGIANYGAGASGGGIYITCGSFAGAASALLRANGGNGTYPHNLYGGGAGGGGRIAVWRKRDLSASAASNSVSGGIGWLPNSATTNAAPGSVIYGWIPLDGTLIEVR